MFWFCPYENVSRKESAAYIYFIWKKNFRTPYNSLSISAWKIIRYLNHNVLNKCHWIQRNNSKYNSLWLVNIFEDHFYSVMPLKYD